MLRFLAKTNWTVTGLTVCAVLFTQSAGVAYFGVGAVVCTVTVKLLKRILRQPRPARHSQKKKTYGMPSTHSASITYFAVFIPLACAYLPIQPLAAFKSSNVFPAACDHLSLGFSRHSLSRLARPPYVASGCCWVRLRRCIRVLVV